jgi:hypothetical protein
VKKSLDEMISALEFVASQVRDESLQRWQESEVSQRQIKAQQKQQDQTLFNTMGFCLSMFIEFAFCGQINANGTQYRTYSALRSELQGIFTSSHCQWMTAAMDKIQNGETMAPVNALSLAKALCEEFANRPVKSLVWDDCEEVTVQRIASVMATQGEELVVPLKKFVKQTLCKPLLLHDFPRDCFVKLADMCATAQMELVDLLGLAQDVLTTTFPFPWVAFAADVSDVYATKQHFIEGTDEVRWKSIKAN